jgi:hypothetical protein
MGTTPATASLISMVQIELTPSLTHCIETIAREEYSTSLNQYLEQSRGDRDLEERIELLRLFLESADFTQLRHESEKHLAAGSTVRFILYLEAGKPKYDMGIDV